jgi:hypothetical protein
MKPWGRRKSVELVFVIYDFDVSGDP